MEPLDQQVHELVSRVNQLEWRILKCYANLATSLFEKFLWLVALHLGFEYKVIYNKGKPYLLRVYLYRGTWFRHLYLHYFFSSDTDRDPHNHPVNTVDNLGWDIPSKSLILTKGYREERMEISREGRLRLKARDIKPWTINTIYFNTFHKVELVHGNCWTLFMPGWKSTEPDKEDWGFFDIDNNVYHPWKPYVEERDNG